MQALSVLPMAPTFIVSDEFSSISAKFSPDSNANLKIKDEREEEGEEFSFMCTNPQGLLVSADDIFDNGKIRPIFPVFNQTLHFTDEHDDASTLRPPLRKLLVEQLHRFSSEPNELRRSPEAQYCEWSQKIMAVEGSDEKGKKRNSTGFSKLWRFRDLKLRSNSDGKDAFIFWHLPAVKKPGRSSGGRNDVVVKEGKGGKPSKTASFSTREKHYVMNGARKESDKRKSYLPYRKQLVGIFANVNGFSRNIHPF